MIALILAALIASDTPAPAPVDPSLATAQDNFDRAQQLYTQSCADRAYGAYDDLCDQLSKQVRQYRVDLDRQERLATQKAAKKPFPKP